MLELALAKLLENYKMESNVPEKNLEFMLCHKKEGMIYFLEGESGGGSAGRFGKYPLVAANFHYDKDDGKIDKCSVDIPECERLHRGIFKLILDLKREKNQFFEIIKLIFDKNSSEEAKLNLRESVRLYNEEMKKQS